TRGLGERLSAYAYIAPFFVLFTVFGLFPFAFTFYVALFDWNPIGDQVFIGADNFTRMFADPRFWNAAGNTVSIWFLSTVPQLLLALVLAHVL
ncbi:sugar ABC transporter permease, partial [Saccharothrix sp. MB29]|nr:sugar ABC transporter permease [Saccharothrix sp. MB29]